GMMMSWEYPVWLAIPLGLAAALVCGLVNGILIAYVGMPPFVVTLGMMSLARSLAMVLSGNQMVYNFGHDHAKLVALGGGSTRGCGLRTGSGPNRRSVLSSPGWRGSSSCPILRSSCWFSRSFSALPFAGRNGVAIFLRSAAMNRPRSSPA